MEQTQRRPAPPWPVAAAVAVVALFALGSIVMIVLGLVGSLIPLAVIGAIGLFVSGSTALGLWQGRRGARVVACLIGLAILATSLRLIADNGAFALLPVAASALVVAFLTVPARSRAWFRP